MFLLAGCGREESKSESAYIEDVKISQESYVYYRDDNSGHIYKCTDAILISSVNDFKCIDTDIEYDEELGVYTCTVKFKKIIDK
jgi:hypothetical protein